jgi:hypothetical protein
MFAGSLGPGMITRGMVNLRLLLYSGSMSVHLLFLGR